MVDLRILNDFLLKANMPHAYGTADMHNEINGSRTITFSEAEYSMQDNFFGGEPYGGQQVVFYKGEPIWICVYYGRVLDTQLSSDTVYDFLRKSLQHPEKGMPQRGPKSYKQGNLEYQNRLEGNLKDYVGREVILENGKEIYWARYMGGLVDQRFKGSV